MSRYWTLGLIFMVWGCQPVQHSNYSREAGQVSVFSELVAAGVKPLALSAPMSSEEMNQFEPIARQEAAQYGVSVFRENELIRTDLFADSIVTDQEVLLICDTLTKQAYDQLKADLFRLESSGLYTDSMRVDVARRFGRLLGYTPQGINKLLARQTDFRTLSDFGVEATNLFWYYRNRAEALEFYTKTLGLTRVAEYDNATILQIAKDSYLTLVDNGTGMHTADEPKSVALALLTRQLADWWNYLESKNITVRYNYTPRVAGPHDGFVIYDPEGYLLEFETFKQHPENERFMPRLKNAPDVPVTLDHSGAPKGLAFNSTVTWLYYQDVLQMEGFMEQIMGFPLVADQGWAKVYAASSTGYIGLVDERRGMCDYTDDKAVNVSYWLSDIEGWWAYTKENGPFPLQADSLSVGPDDHFKAFVGFDPEGYYMEFNSTLIK